MGISQLNNGTHTLKAGTETLKNETSGMDQEITRQIDALLEEITGGGAKTLLHSYRIKIPMLNLFNLSSRENPY